MRRWINLSLLLICLLLVFPASAQETIWFAYFYDNQTATLNYVNADGRTESFSLGLEANPRLVDEYDFAFAHSRTEVAYCLANEPYNEQGPAEMPATLVFRDIPNQRNSREMQLGLVERCWVGAYNGSDTLLSVGISHLSTNAAAPAWEILVIDTISFSVIDSINSSDPAAAHVIPFEGGEAYTRITPAIFWMDDETVLFEAGGFEGTGLAYAFNRTSRTISPYTSYGDSYQRFGSEEIWLSYLKEYPVASIGGPGYANNALMYKDSTGAERIIYYTADWGIVRSVFINGGQEIAIFLAPRFEPERDPNNPYSANPKWIVLDREGHERDLLVLDAPSENTVYHSFRFFPAFTGYGLLEIVSDTALEQHNYHFSLVDGDSQTQLWEQTDTFQDAGWNLVYTPEAPYQDFGDFPAVDMSSVPLAQ